MRKAALILILMSLLPITHASASWAYKFVVFLGNTYIVSEDEVPANRIGSVFGKVTRYSDEEGTTYSGNFSNALPVGTEYHAIIGIDIQDAIAVKNKEGVYVKATYSGPYAKTDNFGSKVGRTIDRLDWQLTVGLVLLIAAGFTIRWRIRRRSRGNQQA